MHRILLRPIVQLAAVHAGRQWARFQGLWGACAQTQDNRLMRIVREGADSDFGRRHHFHRIRSYADFAAALPLAQYPYFSPYIE